MGRDSRVQSTVPMRHCRQYEIVRFAETRLKENLVGGGVRAETSRSLLKGEGLLNSTQRLVAAAAGSEGSHSRE